MRLIDADRLFHNLERGVRNTSNQVFREIANTPTEKAIPVEWIKEKLEKEEYRTFLVDYIEWRSCLHWLLEAWEEENETDR